MTVYTRKLQNNLLFIIGYALLVITDMCKKIPFILENQKIISGVGYVFIAIYILLNIQKFKTISRKKVILYVTIAAISLLSLIKTTNFTIIRLLLLILSTYCIGFDELVKKDLKIKLLLMSLLVFLSSLNIIEDWILLRDNLTERHSFGFTHPNAIGFYMVFSLIEASYLTIIEGGVKMKKKLWLIIALNAVFLIFNFIFLDSRATMTISGILMLYIIKTIFTINKKTKKKMHKKTNNSIVINNLFAIITILIFTIVGFCKTSPTLLTSLDKIFSMRFTNYIYYLQNINFSLLGNPIPETYGGIYYLDSMYIKIILAFGVLSILYFLIYNKNFKKAKSEQTTIANFILLLTLIMGITDTNMMVPTINIFLLFFTKHADNIAIPENSND